MQQDILTLTPAISDNNTRRLNFIAGRYLSEQEFDVMQEYVDARCQDLLLTRTPGIVRGLDLIVPQDFEKESIQVNAGLGISYSGRSVGVRIPIWFYWKDLCDNYREEQHLSTVKDGYYFLTLRRKVVILDEVISTDPNTRTEPDPLRDSRLETLGQVNLQWIPMASTVMSFSRQRACMRIMKLMLNEKHISENPHEIKIAVVKIVGQKIAWIDTKASRFLTQDNNVYQTLLSYWHDLLKSPTPFRLDGPALTFNGSQSLQEILDLDFLPTAGKFPSSLIKDIAGHQDTDDVTKWDRPTLQFNPNGLQFEIVPVPANSVAGVIQKEMSRGLVDLLNGEADRIRLMVAVNSNDYDPKLMDLPDYDHQMLQDLCDAEKKAMTTYQDWTLAFYQLYENLDSEIAFESDGITPTADSLNLLASVYFSKIPASAFLKIYPVDGSDPKADQKWKALGFPVREGAPTTVQNFLLIMKENRRQKLDPKGLIPKILFHYPPGFVPVSKDLPRPYSLAVNFDPDLNYQDNRTTKDGLFEQRVKIKKDIEKIQSYLDSLNKLIDETRDYLSHHRQQLDSITVSFASLAGGVPGDGTGLKLMRWADQLTFKTVAATTK